MRKTAEQILRVKKIDYPHLSQHERAVFSLVRGLDEYGTCVYHRVEGYVVDIRYGLRVGPTHTTVNLPPQKAKASVFFGKLSRCRECVHPYELKQLRDDYTYDNGTMKRKMANRASSALEDAA